MNPLTMLPKKVRTAIYAGYATLGVAFGATQVGFATAHVDQPAWLLVAFGVFGYLGTALGLVAAANTADPAPVLTDMPDMQKLTKQVEELNRTNAGIAEQVTKQLNATARAAARSKH
ncbi:hypothetical protein [Nocardioides sp. YIM 152315]|uniref:hypothetical protein n=1 Tax=Nocardioides sp. YIM 152315 TaxID=3031760 RepID=UPI0023DBBA42|nr:hypothetical protein [Nocardioides sp. YIM 152315]MDF1603413.1 hypothetical protein [Nocardioides sp. YIM 152315]